MIQKAMLFQKMRLAITPHLTAIHMHPFNIDLGNGTLPKPVFRAFIEQDRLYYLDFSKALKQTATRLTHKEHQRLFFNLSDDILKTEAKLHQKYLAKNQFLSLFQPTHIATEKNMQITQYTEYLLATSSNAPIEVAVASVLPCFYIYSELGQQMKLNLKENNPYRLFIGSYSSERFLSSTQSIINTVHELENKLGFLEEKQMIEAFIKSTEFEISFWDSLYKTRRSAQNDDSFFLSARR